MSSENISFTRKNIGSKKNIELRWTCFVNMREIWKCESPAKMITKLTIGNPRAPDFKVTICDSILRPRLRVPSRAVPRPALHHPQRPCPILRFLMRAPLPTSLYRSSTVVPPDLTPTDAAPPVPPQHVQSLLTSSYSFSIDNASQLQAPRATFATTTVVPARAGRHDQFQRVRKASTRVGRLPSRPIARTTRRLSRSSFLPGPIISLHVIEPARLRPPPKIPH